MNINCVEHQFELHIAIYFFSNPATIHNKSASKLTKLKQ